MAERQAIKGKGAGYRPKARQFQVARKQGNLPPFTESTVCQLWQVDDGADEGGGGVEGRRETSKDRRQRLQT